MVIAFYLASLCIILAFATILFIVAQHLEDNSIIDTAYGLLFIVTSWLLTIFEIITADISKQSILILTLITIWGIRLSLRIYRKNMNKAEDFRYKAWRDAWKKNGSLYYYVRSYFQIFVLQGIVVSIVLLPFSISLLGDGLSYPMLIIGVVLWCIGFVFEAVGDAQLDAFISDKNKTDVIMKSGLWRYTRHPNYFGESMMWWGLAIVAYSVTSSLVVFLSPILITYFLIEVSGIPMLEKKWEGIPEWEDYKSKTSAFFPLPKEE